MSEENINVKVKMTSNNSVYDIQISPTASVLDLKKDLTEKSGLKDNEQNLVYKGKILADDKNLNDYNVQNDHTIILVKKYVATENTTTEDKSKTETTGTTQNTSNTSDPFSMFGQGGQGGMGGLGGLGQGGMGNVDPSQLNSMLSNPMYMNMMSEMMGDPNTLNMIMNSPQLKPLLDSNPQLRTMMQNPQMLQMMMNPQNLQNAMGMMGQGGSGTGGNNPFGNMSGLGGTGTSTSTNTNVDPKEAYKEQNQRLKDMGFINEDLNFDVLKQTNGNVDLAVEKLLNMMN